MVDKNLFERVWSGVRGFSRRVAEGAAQLTNWQFILLCLLALIGAGILQAILESPPAKRSFLPVAITINKEEQQPADKVTTPDARKPAPSPADPLEDAIKKKILTEIQKGINSESADPLEDAIKKKILTEIQKGIDGESGALNAAKAIKQEILREVHRELENESTSGNMDSDGLKGSMDSNGFQKSQQKKKTFNVHVGGVDTEDTAAPPDHRLPLAPIVFFLIIVLLAVRITTRSLQRAEKRVLSAETSAEMESLRRQVTEAQLQTLQAQVEPHFLFNTLAAVEHLTETDPPRATVMMQHLIAFLRGSLPDMREQHSSLGREVDLCRSYLAIMQIRMEDRLTVSIDVPESLRGLSFPPMMLQSLVENSIKHGLEPKPAGGAIALSARLQNGRLRVTVADTGLGIAENAPQGVGLGNIRDRLMRLYGNSAALVLAPNAPTGAHITIEIGNAPADASHTGR